MDSQVQPTGSRPRKSHAAVTRGGSTFRRYQDVIVGRRSLWALLYYEWCSWLSPLPGAVGILLRKLFWSRLFGSCGKGVLFGQNIILRHPHRIHLGDRVVISDGCVLDARNEESNRIIVLAGDIILSNNVVISCKDGTVTIGPRTGLGAQSIIHSTAGCPVTIGADVMIGSQCYLVGGGNYHVDRLDIPMWQQGIKRDNGVSLEDDIWLGAKVTVLSGVVIGKGSIVGAGAVVTRPMPAQAVCVGVPATVVKMRTD